MQKYVLNVLLGGLLLHGALCERFGLSLPQTQIEAVRGSCVTIPCSFSVRDSLKQSLHSGCRAIWKDETREFTGETEDLTQRNCTTTVYNVNDQHHGTFYFRLDCFNDLKWSYLSPKVNIVIKGAPPTLTLTPPTLNVTEGHSVNVQCSAPVPCLSLPPSLTWSPVLADTQETFRKESQTFVKVSTLSFTAAHSLHEKNITCSAVYSREDVPSELRLSAQIRPDVKYGPRDVRVTVTPAGAVTEHSNVTLRCSGEAHPPVQLYLWFQTDRGSPSLIGNSSVLNLSASKHTPAVFCQAQNDVGSGNSSVTQLHVLYAPKILSSPNCTGHLSQRSCLCEVEGNPSPLIHWYFPGVSANISITNEAVSDTSVRSTITVTDLQSRDPVSLLCHSSNSLGSDKHTFTFSVKAPIEQQGPGGVLTVALVPTAVLLVLVLLLLSVIGSLALRLKKLQSAPKVTQQHPENAADRATSGSEDVLYSTVTFKTSSTEPPSCRSYLEEQRSVVGNECTNVTGKVTECEYAQVKFKPRPATKQ